MAETLIIDCDESEEREFDLASSICVVVFFFSSCCNYSKKNEREREANQKREK